MYRFEGCYCDKEGFIALCGCDCWEHWGRGGVGWDVVQVIGECVYVVYGWEGFVG